MKIHLLKDMSGKIGVSFLMLLPRCPSRVIPVHVAYACLVQFPCMWLVIVPCNSHAYSLCTSYACSLCTSHAVLLHATYVCPVCYSLTSKKVSYTQDLPPDDSNHDLNTPKCGLWKEGGHGSLSLSLSRGGR